MGCIVNGVGEMADADFGYVGGAPGKVSVVQMSFPNSRKGPSGSCIATGSAGKAYPSRVYHQRAKQAQSIFLYNRRQNQVDLYVGKELVQRGIPNEEACDALIDLIKANDRWVEKEPAEEEVVAA